MAETFRGLFPALTTPFEGEAVSPARLRDNIARFNAFDLAGYLVGGSTGECVSISEDETASLVQAAREAAAPGRRIIVGTGRESSRLTIEATHRAAGLGADAALVRPPSYYKARLNREALKRHFTAVADAARIPVILYNVPQNTQVPIEPALALELAAHPNIVGLKESSASLAYLEETLRAWPPGFSYLLGSAYLIAAGLQMGAAGAILAVANAAPAVCVEIFEHVRAGRMKDAVERQIDLVPLNKAVMETYGIPGLKRALDEQGFYGGPVRLPLLPLDEKGAADIAGLLKKLRR